VGERLPDGDQLAGFRVREWTHQNAINYGEHRRRGTDPNPKREDGYRAKRRTAPHLTEGETQILKKKAHRKSCHVGRLGRLPLQPD
jgi:hypothetical protein